MSDDTLTSLITEAIARNLAPLLKWLYCVFAAVIGGTVFVVGMVYDVRQGIDDASTTAKEAKVTGAENREAIHRHETRIAVLESKRETSSKQ